MRLEKRLADLSKPEHYVKVLSDTFRMRNALGEWFDYEPMSYQVEWHKKFILADPSAPHRLWHKCRGIGATACTMMDLLMLACTYHGLTIPISSITGKQVQMGPIKWGIELCENTRVPGIIPRDVNISSAIRITSTGSTIFTIPGNSPNALRSYRAPALFYDEFDWCAQQAALLGAGEDVVNQEPAQITMVSTIQNVRGQFQRLIDGAEELGYWVHKTPLFGWDGAVCDPTRSLLDQVAEGLITPVAPWIDIKKVENQRKRNVAVFLRENMCTAPDVGINFLSWDLIQKSCNIKPRAFDNPSGYQGDQFKKYTMLQRPKDNMNPFAIGWDFARFHDLAVAEVVEFTPFGVIQRYEQTMRGSDTPTQNSLLRSLNKGFNPMVIRIDMTGAGTGLYDYAYTECGSKVEGIHFASTMEIEETRGRVKDALALNLRTLMQDNKFRGYDSLEVKDDLHSVSYDLKDSGRTEEGSHGDRFWALALAVWPPFDNSPFLVVA